MKKSITIPAPLWKRACAYLIDALILSLIIYVPLKKAVPTAVIDQSALFSPMMYQHVKSIIISFLIVALLTILYWSILEYKTSQSLGKMLMKLKVQSTEKSLTFRQCVLRNLTKISSLFLLLDTLYILKSGTRRFFDVLSRTEVIDVSQKGK